MTTQEDYTAVPPNSTGNKIQSRKWWDGVKDIFTPTSIIVDTEDPTIGLALDNKGAAFVRFADGSPQFDVFGRLLTSEETLMGTYKFYENAHSFEFEKTEAGGGTVTHDLANRGIKLTCGTANGDSASYISHRHYSYRPLNDMPAHFTFTQNAGIVNRTREIGYFSSGGDKIIFEEVDGEMNVLILDNLSNITTRIPRSAWNGDRLDGSSGKYNRSKKTYAETKGSIWTISLQYLSMGIVEFGQIIEGVPTLLHREGHYGELDRPYMKSASLAFGFTQTNTGICASTGEFKVHCVTISNRGYDDFVHSQAVVRASKTVSSGWTTLFSFSPAELNYLGEANRGRLVPRLLSVLAKTSAIELRTDYNPVLTGDTWTGQARLVAYDTTATSAAISDDTRIFGREIGAGVSDNTDISVIFDINKKGLVRHRDAATTDYFTVSARLFDATDADTLVALTTTIWNIE